MPKHRPARTILIVDDDRQSSHMMGESLRAAGFEIKTAPRAARALELLESRAGAGVRLVIIDLALPDLDGMELAVRVGILRGDLKILIISGYADAIVVHNEFDGHNLDFISKPLDMNMLKNKIQVLLK